MAVGGAAQRRGQQKSKCHHSFMESCDFIQYLVESIQKIIGMARVGFKRLIAQKTTLNVPQWYPFLFLFSSTPIQSEEPANQPLQHHLHKIIVSSAVTGITNGNCSKGNNVSVKAVLGNGLIFLTGKRA